MATRRKPTADDLAEAVEDLEEIERTIREALANARDTMRRVGGLAKDRAEVYWIRQIEGSLEGGSMCSLRDTIEGLVGGEE